MAVDIGQIVSSALGGAESSFARKEQRMNLADQRRSNTRKELNNRAINSFFKFFFHQIIPKFLLIFLNFLIILI